MSNTFSSFKCSKCNTEIQASADMVGQEAECPACGEHLIIPEPDGLVRHGMGDDDPDSIQAMKSRTIRIELGDL